MRIGLTKHCVEQIKIRKRKASDKDAVNFAKGTFAEMISTKMLGGTPCVRRRGNNGKEIIQHTKTGYKFVFSQEDEKYVLITFAIHTHLDHEIGKLLKNLESRRLKAERNGHKRTAIEF